MAHVASTDTPQRGVRVGVDVGSVRVGVAISDPDCILATPVATLARDMATLQDLADIAALVAEHDAVEVVVGLPRTLRGADGAAAIEARSYAAELAGRVAPVPITFVDERMSSVEANRVLFDRKVPGRSRKKVVDQIAAVTILQTHLDVVRRQRAAHA